MNILFIGLGNMGMGMVLNLLKKNHSVFCYDIDTSKLNESVTSGAIAISRLQDIPSSIDTAILCLPHPNISKQTVTHLLNSSVHTIIETSTLTPELASALYNQASKHGKDYLGGPMLGGKNHAVRGEIHFLVEGNQETFERYESIFLTMGSRADYMGAPPKATLTKLAYNIARYGNIALGVTIARFIHAYEQDTNSIFEILKEGATDSFGQVWQEDVKEMIRSGTPYQPTHIPEKDLSFIQTLVEGESEQQIIKALLAVYKTLPKENKL